MLDWSPGGYPGSIRHREYRRFGWGILLLLVKEDRRGKESVGEVTEPFSARGNSHHKLHALTRMQRPSNNLSFSVDSCVPKRTELSPTYRLTLGVRVSRFWLLLPF